MLIVSTRAERFNLKHDILALDENTARRIYEDIFRIVIDSSVETLWKKPR